jgi:hypothetical protein
VVLQLQQSSALAQRFPFFVRGYSSHSWKLAKAIDPQCNEDAEKLVEQIAVIGAFFPNWLWKVALAVRKSAQANLTFVRWLRNAHGIEYYGACSVARLVQL